MIIYVGEFFVKLIQQVLKKQLYKKGVSHG